MSKLKQVDFYYGAFLSALLNDGKQKPSLFDTTEDDSRRIYCLTTDSSTKDYIIYTKHATGRTEKRTPSTRWKFSFNPQDIEKIRRLKKDEKYQNVYLALICVKKGLGDSEIAFVESDKAFDCLGIKDNDKNVEQLTLSDCATDKKNPKKSNKNIYIIAVDSKHGLKMYGSGRARNLHGKDNTIKVPRDALKSL